MLVLEVIGFEIMTLILGSQGQSAIPHLAAHNICYAIESIIWTVAGGFGNGASTRVGNLLGEQKPEEYGGLRFSFVLTQASLCLQLSQVCQLLYGSGDGQHVCYCTVVDGSFEVWFHLLCVVAP